MFASRFNMDEPTRVFLVLSGEHPTLPLAEMRAILDANRIPFKITGSFYKLVEIQAEIEAVKPIAGRGAFIDEVGTEIVHSGSTITEIDDAVKSSDLSRHLPPDESFSVRVLRFGGVSKETSRVKLEGHLGWLIHNITRAKVDLENPQRLFHGQAGDRFRAQRPRSRISARRGARVPARRVMDIGIRDR